MSKELSKSESSSSDFNVQNLKNWQSQDEFMKDLEDQLDNVDPIRYKQIKYHQHEWDNIPPVVPKFIINLSKYVKGLSQLAYKAHTNENVEGLRSWTESQFSVSSFNTVLNQPCRNSELECLTSTQTDSLKKTSCCSS